MTVDELIKRLHTLPPDLPVYGIDPDRDWLPLRNTDIRLDFFTKLGRDTARDDDFYFTMNDNDDHNSPNGVGIGI
jgi:hypothetical protein